MKKKMGESILLYVFVIVLILSLLMIFVENALVQKQITGFATASTTSNVTISKYLSISMSTNLISGIIFGNVTSLPATDINATHNYDNGASGTSMLINVSSDSNTKVDFCLRTNDDLYDSVGGNRLAIGNESYSNSTITDDSIPVLSQQVSLNKTGYIKAGQNVTQGYGVFYRFWLDVPSGTASGTYNNTVTFEGVEIATNC